MTINIPDPGSDDAELFWREAEIRKKVLRAALRSHLSPFIQKAFQTVSPGYTYLHGRHIDAIAYALERCVRGETTRLIINVAPRSLKSISGSVAFVAWLLGLYPRARIICASYNQELADKNARDTRAIIEAHWYRSIFPRTRIDPNHSSVSDFDTTARGMRLSTSVGGQLTGRGGGFLIVDDPQKASEIGSKERRDAVHEWFRSTVISRLDDQHTGVIILIQQRLHEDDLSGRLLAEGGWEHLNLPAIAEESQDILLGPGYVHRRAVDEILYAGLTLEDLNRLKREIGSAGFAAQYQQNPTPAAGNIINWEWFGVFDVEPVRQPGDEIVQSWDTASKAEEIHDYSVGTTWLVRKKALYLLNVFRRRLEYPDLRRQIVAMAQQWRASAILIEDKSSGIELIQDLRHSGRVRPIPIKPRMDKISRLHVQSPIVEAGSVLLPKAAPWLEDFKREILAFPTSKHDDQVDSFTQFLEWYQNRRPPMVFV